MNLVLRVKFKSRVHVKQCLSELVSMVAVPLMNMSNAEIDTQLCHLYGFEIVVDFGFHLKHII